MAGNRIRNHVRAPDRRTRPTRKVRPRGRSAQKPLRDDSRYPLLPLGDLVLFPHMIAPLVVSTPRSLRLIEAVGAGDRLFVAVLQKDARIEDDAVGPEHLHSTGCLTRMIKVLRFPDETVRILVQGQSRFRIEGVEPQTEPYLRATGSVLKERAEPTIEMEALARNASIRFQEVITLSPTLPEELKIALFNTEEPGRLSDLIASNLNMPTAERQGLLESDDIRARLERITEILNREKSVLELGQQIQDQVAEAVGKHQREYFLREQLRILRKELGESDPLSAEREALEARMAKAELPEEARQVAEKEIERLGSIPPASPEYGVIRTYLDWLADMPWRHETRDHLDIGDARRRLDRDHFDLDKAKGRILEYLAVLKLKGNMRGPILCLTGPPGVGKTSLGRSIASALGRKFTRISLGGVRDEAEIRGHRRTYIGAMPGRIIQGIRRAGSRNPVFMLDEIDKMGSDFRGDPSAALMEVLDPEQNHTFVDHYLDVAFDLSSVFFLCTANTLDTVHAALRDRLEVIEIPGYTLGEKRQIARKHLLPKQIKAHGLRAGQMGITREALDAVIEGYTREAGVRNLERELAGVCRKIALRRAEGRRVTSPVGPRVVHLLLGPPRCRPDAAESTLSPGVATALAWTPAGGEILFIEATRMPGSGHLSLTGSLGEVMKESAMAALSLVRSQGYGCRVEADFQKKTDVHIHVPAGAIAKDGPSAGLAIVAAIVSMLRDQAVPATMAMTGEVTLRGRVLPVGGIKEKILAAARAGIRTLILPLKNRPDLSEIPAEIAHTLTFRFAGTVERALRILFEDAGRSARPRPARKARAR